ncbi:MAG TPA: GAF domain-containing protein [candidate division WOR-3 bacterium]|uniref:GAF domain-containing protein n=1 Tax=candidate division WOR-3 bacterium TaxID=2052148 RepID=A0A9C9ELM9_UNCW3|nr:GAF domain-containing protein [candidate division WOR-3 bacterium]
MKSKSSKKTDEPVKLTRKIKRLETLIHTSMIFSSILDIDDLLNIVLRKAEEVMDAEASSVFRIDEEKNELYFITARGEKGQEAKEIRVPMGKGIVGWVAKHGKSLLVADVRKDPRWFKGVDKKTKFVTRSIIAVPLIAKGKIIGVAEVLNKRGNRKFNKTDLELFESLGHQIAIAIENASLYKELDELFLSSIRAIVEAVDAKDPYTRGHSSRVVKYSLIIGEALKLGKEELKKLEISAILHDVGKIGIPDRILGKPGKLTFEEFAYMKRHPVLGSSIIEPIAELRDIIPNILHHHERYDGNGYPHGLKGKKIPLYARIICVADSFDAITTDRPYRRRKSFKTALNELKRNSGTQFDARLVRVFIKEFKEHHSQNF